MKCLCGAQKTTSLFSAALYDVVRCIACGLVRTQAQRGTKRVSYYEEEDATFYVDNQDMFRRLFAEKLQWIRQFVPCGTMLDIGAGVGLFLDEARKLGYRVVGFEPSKASVALAKKHFGIRLMNSEFSARGGLENADVIVINHVLEHLKDPKEVIAQCAAMLKPGRALVIGVPNFDSFLRSIKRGRWQSLIPEQHRWQFSLPTLDQLVTPHGFRRRAVSYENHDRSMHYWWKRPVYWVLDQLALWTGYAEAMLVIYEKI